MSGDFTRIGFLFWEWQPVRHLDPVALKLWMVIYTKSIIPGLWTGDVPDLASQSFLSSEDTLRGLEILRDRDLIEFDRANRVLRLTQLPDAGEWPAAPNILKSWWTTFNRKVSACQVRDAHVATLRWLVDEGAKSSAKNVAGKPSPLHEQIWSETFATVSIPASRRRGVRSFGEADMGTYHQPSLFSNPFPEASVPVVDVVPQSPERPPVDNSGPNEINNSDGSGRVSKPSGEGEGAGDGVFSFSEEGGSGGGVAGGKPHLVLVPMPPEPPPAGVVAEVEMFDPETLSETLRSGLGRHNGFRFSPGQERELAELVSRLAAIGIGEPDLPVLADWLAHGGMRITGVSVSLYTQVDWWLEGDHLAKSVRSARVWKQEAEERQRDLAQARDQAGV